VVTSARRIGTGEVPRRTVKTASDGQCQAGGSHRIEPLATRFAYNGDGIRTSKTVGGDTTLYVLDLAAAPPVVISDTEAVYVHGLDIIEQQTERLYWERAALTDS
jgi:hypothetical protein